MTLVILIVTTYFLIVSFSITFFYLFVHFMLVRQIKLLLLWTIKFSSLLHFIAPAFNCNVYIKVASLKKVFFSLPVNTLNIQKQYSFVDDISQMKYHRHCLQFQNIIIIIVILPSSIINLKMMKCAHISKFPKLVVHVVSNITVRCIYSILEHTNTFRNNWFMREILGFI